MNTFIVNEVRHETELNSISIGALIYLADMEAKGAPIVKEVMTEVIAGREVIKRTLLYSDDILYLSSVTTYVFEVEA